MRPPFTLIPDAVSHDTVKCLETLLRHVVGGSDEVWRGATSCRSTA